MELLKEANNEFFKNLYREDDLERNMVYLKRLPKDLVLCRLKIKSDLVLSGGEYFAGAFSYLGDVHIDHELLKKDEGKWILEEYKREYEFTMPFNVALTGERLALNLLQRSSAISSVTKNMVDKAAPKGIKIIDTRKTTPGLRSLEKNAVVSGGGV